MPRRGTCVARAFGFVIAVEEVGPTLVEWAIARHMVAKDEGLEEPGRVREMPFGGGCIRERLDGRVGIAERRGELERELARRKQPLGDSSRRNGAGLIERGFHFCFGTPG